MKGRGGSRQTGFYALLVSGSGGGFRKELATAAARAVGPR